MNDLSSLILSALWSGRIELWNIIFPILLSSVFKSVFILVMHTNLLTAKDVFQVGWLSMIKSITVELAELSWIIQEHSQLINNGKVLVWGYWNLTVRVALYHLRWHTWLCVVATMRLVNALSICLLEGMVKLQKFSFRCVPMSKNAHTGGLLLTF